MKCFLEAVIHEVKNEAEQTESQTPIALKTEDQMQPNPNASKTSASFEQTQALQIIFQSHASGCRFKILAE